MSLWSVKFGAPGPLRSFRPHPNTFPLPPDASVFLDIFPLVYSVQRVCGFRAPGCFSDRPRRQNLPIASGSRATHSRLDALGRGQAESVALVAEHFRRLVDVMTG